MSVIAILRRWIEVLAATFIGARDAWRATRSLKVAFEEGRFTIRRAGPDGASVLAAVLPGAHVSAEVARVARGGLVVLELPADKVVTRRISVPSQAQAFLTGIVRNQIERLSPWQSEQAIFGFDTKVNHEDASVLDVRILITSRTVVDGARGEVTAIGLPPDRVVARERDEPNTSEPVLMWSRLADPSRDETQRTCWLIGVAIAICVVLSSSLSLWSIASASAIGEESENVAARLRVLQRQIQASPTAASTTSLGPGERAWIAKETSPSAVIVLEALSRALPDSAYLSELHVENATLRIIGLTSDAPSLIAPLEGSGYLADVHFFAPTTRGPDGTRFRFYIEARINPQPEIGGPQPW
jgi:general secretion pathway protein L